MTLALAAPPGRTVPYADKKVLLDLTDQVIAARVVDRPGYAIAAVPAGAPAPNLSQVHTGRFVSASLLEHKAVLFDEGMQAALAQAATQGIGKLVGRRQLLRLLLSKLDAAAGDPAVDEVAAQLHAAAEVALLKLPIPDRLAATVQAKVVHFRRTDPRAFPLGIGSFSPELAAAQAMDALLTSPLGNAAGAVRLATTVRGDGGLRRGFQAQANLRRVLTRDAQVHDIFDLIKLLDSKQPPSLPNLHLLTPWISLQTVVLDEVRARKLDGEGRPLAAAALELLQPPAQPSSETPAGLIGHRRHALAALASPSGLEEARRLKWDASYSPLLTGLVATSLQLDRPLYAPLAATAPRPQPRPVAAAPLSTSAGVMVQATKAIAVWPEITVEPLPTYYLRRALAYRELRRALEDILGPRGVAALHRIGPRGESPRTLDVELREMESIFHGAHLTARKQLGLEPAVKGTPRDLGRGATRDLAFFETWSKDLKADPDLGPDGRVMIPITHDPRSKRTRVLVRLGYSGLPLQVEFAVPPKATVVDSQGKPIADASVRWVPLELGLIYPVTAEVLVKDLLPPREMRELCDRQRTVTAILKALQAR
jgi:hypothetical protein